MSSVFLGFFFTAALATAPVKIPYGLFGNSYMDLKSAGFVYSCPWPTNGLPSGTNSTGQACAAVNGLITTHLDTVFDGSMFLGESVAGVPAVWSDPGAGTIFSGVSGVQLGHIDPDPLGAATGVLAQAFAEATTNNNNGGASISKVVGSGKTLTLSEGNYCFTQLDMKLGSFLVLNAATGAVRVFLMGRVDINASSVVLNGPATNILFFSNSSEPIYCGSAMPFYGLIYAPFAWVDVKNSGGYYGAIWADDLTVRNTEYFYMLNEFVDFSRPETRDIDADGLYDDWELARWNSTTTQSAAADADLDGYTNLEEFANDTDPEGPSSVPPRLRWSDAAAVELPWSSTGRLYRLWSSMNLADDPAWTPATSELGGTGTNLVFPSDTSPPNGSFRFGVSVP